MSLKAVLSKTSIIVLIVGLFVGALTALSVRFFAYKPYQVHYHANFAVYINGQREQFKDPAYYQEVAVCSSTNDIKTVSQRAHMHENINSVVHVHDHVVTWGQFFEGIGWYVGPNFIQTKDGTMYTEDDTNKLHVIVNGQDYTGLSQITTMVIEDDARVLISYGDISPAELEQEYASVPKSAHHYDVSKDPASCSGTEKVTAKDRFKHLLN